MKARFSLRIKLFGTFLLTITVGFFAQVARVAETAAPKVAQAGTAIVKETIESEGGAAAREGVKEAASGAAQRALESGSHDSGSFLHTLAHRGLHKALEYGWDKAKESYNDYTESDKKKEPVYGRGFQYRPQYNRGLNPQNQFSWPTQNTVSPTGGLKSGVTRTNSSK
jgi:hypothetical protein